MIQKIDPILTPANFRNDFLVAAHIMSEGKWFPYGHLMPVVDIVNRLLTQRGLRILLNMPPRHGKSMSCSWLTPSAYLLKHPSHNVIMTGYGDRFAAKWGKKTRDTVNKFGQFFGVSLDDSSRAKNSWETNKGGGMHCCGVGGEITGHGANLLIMDDLIKGFQTAESLVKRNTVWDWLTADVWTRLEPGANVLYIQTRWNLDDPCGRFEGQDMEGMDDEWEVFNMRAIADEDEDYGSFKRKKGEALCPQRYSARDLEKIKKRLGPYKYNALYNGDPQDPETTLWGSKYFPDGVYQDGFPECQYFVAALDPSAGKAEREGDYQALCFLGMNRGQPALNVDFVVVRQNRTELCRTIVGAMKEKFEQSGRFPDAFAVERDYDQDSSLGIAIQVAFNEASIPTPVSWVESGGVNKRVRIRRLDQYICEYKVRFTRSGGTHLAVNQFKEFPARSAHDDAPDAMEMATRLLEATY